MVPQYPDPKEKMQPTRERTPSVPWSKYIKKNPEKIEMRNCIRFSLDKNNIVCNDFNERKEDLYVYNQFDESNTSKLPTRKMHPFPDSKLKYKIIRRKTML